MKFSRKASIPAAVAVTLGLVATGVSCTGSNSANASGRLLVTTSAPGNVRRRCSR